MTRLEINGAEYIPLKTVAEELGISRQTLWRWRRDEHVPAGHRHRSGQVLFTVSEFKEIQSYATRLDPIDSPAGRSHIRRFSELDDQAGQ